MNGYIFSLLASESASQNKAGNVILLIIGIIVAVLAVIGGLIALVFVVANAFQNKKPKKNLNAKLVGNQPYITALDLLGQIKSITNQDVTRAIKAVQSVCDRLRNESDFGLGSFATIDCENEIADCLKSIENDIYDLRNEDTLIGATENVETACLKILGKLKVRIQLKMK